MWLGQFNNCFYSWCLSTILGFLREIVLVALTMLPLQWQHCQCQCIGDEEGIGGVDEGGKAVMVAANFPLIPVRGSRIWHWQSSLDLSVKQVQMHSPTFNHCWFQYWDVTLCFEHILLYSPLLQQFCSADILQIKTIVHPWNLLLTTMNRNAMYEGTLEWRVFHQNEWDGTFWKPCALNNSRALINYGDVSIQSFIEQGTGNTSAKNLISNVSGDHLV